MSAALLFCAIFAQAPAPRPVFDAFEVATIKPTDLGLEGARFMKMQSVHQFVARNYPVKILIAAAYGVSPQAISGGPAWMESDRYDILAKAPGEIRPNLDEQNAMLRKLLTDRFALTFHLEKKDMSFYALTVAKNGPTNLKQSSTTDAPPEGLPPLIFVLSPQGVSLPARNATMAELAAVMQRAALPRPVLDKTGLTGRYDFTLEWTPDETQFGGQGPKGMVESAKPDLFAALQQQLGLKLEARKGPVDVLVVDKVERPSEN